MLSSGESSRELMTAEQLLTCDTHGMRTELIRGQLVVRELAGYQHGHIASRILISIGVFLKFDQAERTAPHSLGEVLAAETGFTLERHPDTVRAPDVAFVSWDRRPVDRTGFAELAPDLAVEVLSPSDRAGETLRKVADWLHAGTSLVWVVDPARRMVRVYRADGSESTLSESSVLDGEATLPGFSLQVAELFA